MAELDYGALIEAYEEERPQYVELAEKAKDRICELLKDAGITAHVDERAKEPDSFATKALLGAYQDPMREIGDRAGVRVMATYLREVARIEKLLAADFEVICREEKLDALAYNEVGYLGVHIDARLSKEQLSELGEHLSDLKLEIQIRTSAQNAWADVTHDTLYKPAADVPMELKRRVFRLVSLVELFDNEVEAFLSEAERTAGHREGLAMAPLSALLLQRFNVRSKPDKRLSLLLAAAIVPLYSCDADKLPEQLGSWIEDRAERLNAIFARDAKTRSSPLLSQPEVFLILERLENDRARLRQAWPPELPPAWLSELAAAWGVRLPQIDEISAVEDLGY